LISLSNFEEYIDVEILERGQEYYQEGHIGSPKTLTPDHFQFEVEGTTTYQVDLKLGGNNTVDYHACDCPYSYGPICKHIAGALFALAELRGVRKSGTPLISIDDSWEGSPLERALELLDALSEASLRDYLEDQLRWNERLREDFVLQFAHLLAGESTDLRQTFAAQLRDTFDGLIEHRWYLDYEETAEIDKAVRRMLATAERHRNAGRLLPAFYIAMAILQEGGPLIERCDEEAELPYDISCAASLLRKLLEAQEAELAENQRQNAFRALLEAGQADYGEYVRLEMDFLEAASRLCRSPEEATDLQALLEQRSQRTSDQAIWLRIIRCMEGEEAAQAYLLNHLDNPHFLDMALRQAYDAGDQQRAQQLAEQGLRAFENDTLWSLHWRQWLLELGYRQNDLEAVVHHAYWLFLAPSSPYEEYYQQLKAILSPERRRELARHLDKALSGFSSRTNLSQRAYLCIEEGWWEHLLELLRADGSLNTLRKYDTYLIPDYREAILTMYREAIQRYVGQNMGRNHYRTAAYYLQHMKQTLGAVKEAEALKKALLRTYPRRSAMKEEFQKI
jgi:uncharacterized Zn finger protein